tara:strand:- start:1 stop:183 length:183 start_codon:yes stop_codon:yes gene_type:complete
LDNGEPEMIEYLLLLQIPFYIIAAGVWYIAWKMKEVSSILEHTTQHEDIEDEENVGRRRG